MNVNGKDYSIYYGKTKIMFQTTNQNNTHLYQDIIGYIEYHILTI